MAEIVLDEPQFLIFFPLGSAVNQQIVVIVDNLPVPQHAQPFPIFRNGARDPATNTVNVWWLWDGEKEWRVGSLKSAQRSLPLLRIVNDTALIEMIETAYNPEDDGFGSSENSKLCRYLNDARLSAASAFGRLTRKFH